MHFHESSIQRPDGVVPLSHAFISTRSFITRSMLAGTYSLVALEKAPRLFAGLVANLLQLAHLALLARLADQAHPVQTDLFAVAVARSNVDDQAGNVLELDKAKPDVGSAVGVPILLREGDSLCWRGIVGFGEVEVVGLVGVEMDGARTHRRNLVILGRDGGELSKVVLETLASGIESTERTWSVCSLITAWNGVKSSS